LVATLPHVELEIVTSRLNDVLMVDHRENIPPRKKQHTVHVTGGHDDIMWNKCERK